MICSDGKRLTRLMIADFDGGGLKNQQLLVGGQLIAGPAWSPDGQSLLYLAPGGPADQFQLWRLTPGTPPVQVTRDLNLDATSAPAWAG